MSVIEEEYCVREQYDAPAGTIAVIRIDEAPDGKKYIKTNVQDEALGYFPNQEIMQEVLTEALRASIVNAWSIKK